MTTDPAAPHRPRTAEPRRPGDPDKRQLLERFIRVDQAGEYGAVRIYQGQMAVLGGGRRNPRLQHMHDQEVAHRSTFDRLLVERRVRPTVLQPLWHVAGFALGAGTALLGEKAAHACTEAVEEVIDRHYAAQRDQLGEDEAELRDTIERFRQEEVEHRDLARQEGAAEAPAYPLLSGAIKRGTRLAVWLSERF